MLVPVLAAAPFYVADRRKEQRELERPAREGELAEVQTDGSSD
ncbi:hypothetical protein OU415_20600 [Saccharopolyspora sp. WRP15-2]|uniref:Uncharacterized protein n=1 Tax=Saccharopolyspora oryzae TaxID=2997343 RepID=A0ABT4V1L2_9PSEU|nr:hypothetical protein [Saccharopolyspora oryzae]MDA3627848.1 hypothetical protein [Saccharopolyspora oryzae]